MQFLLDAIKNTLQKTKVQQLAAIGAQEGYSIKTLIDLTFHNDEQIGFRAAWILENVYSNHPERFMPHLSYFFEKFPTQVNLSALRHFVKIMAFLTHKKASSSVKQAVAAQDTSLIVEVVFSWLISDRIPVAVKSHCLNILANLVPQHPWVADELMDTMNFLVDKESIAFFAKVKQIRKQLKMG